MMVLVLEDDLKLILVNFSWCQSSTMLLMIVPIFDFSALIPASSISSVIFSMVYRLIIHVSVVISRNHRAVCVQLLLALSRALTLSFERKSSRKKRTTHVQIHEAHNIFHSWDCSCQHFARMYLYPCPHQRLFLVTFHRNVLVLLDVADVHWCNTVNFTYLLFLCAFFMTSFHSFSFVAFAFGIKIAWGERSFVHTSRFPEACLSERQISRVFRNIRNSRFLKFADQNNLRSSYFFLPRFTLESISYSQDFRVTWKIVSKIRCAARRDNMCLISPSKGLSEELH